MYQQPSLVTKTKGMDSHREPSTKRLPSARARTFSRLKRVPILSIIFVFIKARKCAGRHGPNNPPGKQRHRQSRENSPCNLLPEAKLTGTGGVDTRRDEASVPPPLLRRSSVNRWRLKKAESLGEGDVMLMIEG